jgi:hypothetical protein
VAVTAAAFTIGMGALVGVCLTCAAALAAVAFGNRR